MVIYILYVSGVYMLIINNSLIECLKVLKKCEICRP